MPAIGTSCRYVLAASLMSVSPAQVADERADDWSHFEQLEQAEQVNEGDLEVLETEPEEDAHQHINTITIDEDSLMTGWVGLEQCHRHLDSVPALQIVFAPDRTRDLAITRADKVARAWVKDSTVQIEDIHAGSEVCLTATTQALDLGSGKPTLKTGPYMRKFLDGYYPLRVQLRVDYPSHRLRLVQAAPSRFRALDDGSLELDIWFEGELRTRVEFDHRR